MIRIKQTIATIQVIFPRSLALLSADATTDEFTETIMWMYKPIMTRQGKKTIIITWKTPTNSLAEEPLPMMLTLHRKTELGLYSISNMAEDISRHDHTHDAKMHPATFFLLKILRVASRWQSIARPTTADKCKPRKTRAAMERRRSQ